jgi:hypothetical protein
MKGTVININLNWFIFPLALLISMTSAEIAAVAFCVLGIVYSAIKGGKTRWMILLYCGLERCIFSEMKNITNRVHFPALGRWIRRDTSKNVLGSSPWFCG